MSIAFSRYIGMMRRIFLPFLLFLLLLHSIGCKQGTKSGAGQLLALMHEAYEHADYSGVRILADSLHRHYSTDTVARKEALSLSRQAEYKECERNLAFADSACLFSPVGSTACPILSVRLPLWREGLLNSISRVSVRLPVRNILVCVAVRTRLAISLC